jgi:hypothetical protein
VKSGQPKSLLVDLTQHSWDLFVPKGARLTAGPFPFCPLNGAGAAWSLPATQLPWNIKPSVELLPRVSYSHSPPRTKCIAHVRSSGAAPSRLGLLSRAGASLARKPAVGHGSLFSRLVGLGRKGVSRKGDPCPEARLSVSSAWARPVRRAYLPIVRQ